MITIKNPEGFKFEESEHRYTFNGATVLSITQILRSVGISPDFKTVSPEIMRAAAERGTNVHSLCEFYDEDDLGEVHPNYQGYLDGWIKFRKESGFKPELIEQMLYHPTYRYALRLDRAGYIGDKKAVVEIKSGEGGPEDWIECQLMAQKIALEDVAKFGPVYICMAVKLHKDGTYSQREYKDPRARGVTLAAIAVANWKQGR